MSLRGLPCPLPRPPRVLPGVPVSETPHSCLRSARWSPGCASGPPARAESTVSTCANHGTERAPAVCGAPGDGTRSHDAQWSCRPRDRRNSSFPELLLEHWGLAGQHSLPEALPTPDKCPCSPDCSMGAGDAGTRVPCLVSAPTHPGMGNHHSPPWGQAASSILGQL